MGQFGITPEEREVMKALERKQAMELELQKKEAEMQLEQINERLHPTAKVQLRRIYSELKDLRVKLPKIVVK